MYKHEQWVADERLRRAAVDAADRYLAACRRRDRARAWAIIGLVACLLLAGVAVYLIGV